MKRILVLPFFIHHTPKDYDYIPEGILDELIISLAKIPDIKISARSTSIYLKNNPIPITEIHNRFDVDYVLEGSINLQGEELKITVQLFNASVEEILLTTECSTPKSNWIQPIDQLIGDIVKTIGISDKTVPPPSKNTSKDREYYLRGLYHWYRYTHEEMLKAISFFKRSIRENQAFALPHSGMADCYCIIGLMGFDIPIEAYKQAQEAVTKSLLLNDKRSETYVAAAFVNIFYERDFAQGKRNLEQSLRLNKDNVKAHHAMAIYHIHMGELELAEKYSLSSLKLDPMAVTHYAMMIRIKIYQKQYDDALDYVNAAISIDKDAIPLIELRGIINLLTGKIETAIEDFKYCLQKSQDSPLFHSSLSFAYSRAGFFAESRSIEESFKSLNLAKATGLYDYALAIIKLGYSDFDAFFLHCNKALELHLGMAPGELKCNPIFSEVRKDKRFEALLKKCNLFPASTIIKRNKEATSVVSLKSNTKEQLTIDPQDLFYIKGDDNYCTIYWYDSGVLQNKILRATLKYLESQLKHFPNIIRCHKSFMINLHNEFTVTGNAKGYFFDSPYLSVRIPISRTKSKEVIQLYESLTL